KEKPLYVYCLAGGRSAAAAKQLRSMGYKQVYELMGGTNEWKAANKPLEGKKILKQMSLPDFQNSVNAAKTALVDFGAEWCPPCKKMEPVIYNILNKNKGTFTLIRVDGGNDEDIMQQYKVTALPVFIVFKDGKEVWRKEGIASEDEISVHLE
ncbi:MAG: thioredoxin domain-containing protein, partial [Ferruginibacter sp.]